MSKKDFFVVVSIPLVVVLTIVWQYSLSKAFGPGIEVFQ